MPFQIIRNDITRVFADAIVNTANPRPVIGGGTDSAIYRAAGEESLLAERKKIGIIERGQAVSTPAFGLNAKYIIHTVGPVWIDGNHGERETLHACYANSLSLAASLSCESIAFPMIATGVYGFPKDEALDIALKEIGKFLLTHDMDITLVVFDSRSVMLSKKLIGEIDEYIDEHAVGRLRDEEYGGFRGRDYHRRIRMREEFLFGSDFESFELTSNFSLSPKDPQTLACPPSDEDIEWGVNLSAEPLQDLSAPEIPPAWEKKPAASAPRRRSAPSMPSHAELEEDSPKSLDDILARKEDSFQERLFRLIDERKLSDPEVYKRANIDRKVFSKIRCNVNYKPKKKTAVAFAIALKLDMPTMLDLLSRAEIAFSPSNKFDLIVSYFIENKIYDILEINLALFKYGQPILG